MNNIQNYGVTNNLTNNNYQAKKIAFRAQFNTADLKLLAKDISIRERDIDLPTIYTMVEYLKELPGRCATFVKGKINTQKAYLYELHIDGKKVTEGRTFNDNPSEACRAALSEYTVDCGGSYNNLKHRIDFEEFTEMCMDNNDKNVNDLLKLASIE